LTKSDDPEDIERDLCALVPSRSGRSFRTSSSCSGAARAMPGRHATESARCSNGVRQDAKRSLSAGEDLPSALEKSPLLGESVLSRKHGQPFEVRSRIVARRQAELLQIRGAEPERA